MGCSEVETAYVAAHATAIAMIDEVREYVENMPCPELGRVHWGHVGSLNGLCDRLEDVLQACGMFSTKGE